MVLNLTNQFEIEFSKLHQSSPRRLANSNCQELLLRQFQYECFARCGGLLHFRAKVDVLLLSELLVIFHPNAGLPLQLIHAQKLDMETN